MSAQIKKIQTLEVTLGTKPGELSKVYAALKKNNIDVVASWGFEMGPGQAKAIIYPTDLNKAKTALNELHLTPKTGQACYATGDNKVGQYAELLEKVAKAGVNLHATDAFGVGNKFATVFFSEDKDFSTLCKALGC